MMLSLAPGVKPPKSRVRFRVFPNADPGLGGSGTGDFRLSRQPTPGNSFSSQNRGEDIKLFWRAGSNINLRPELVFGAFSRGEFIFQGKGGQGLRTPAGIQSLLAHFQGGGGELSFFGGPGANINLKQKHARVQCLFEEVNILFQAKGSPDPWTPGPPSCWS